MLPLLFRHFMCPVNLANIFVVKSSYYYCYLIVFLLLLLASTWKTQQYYNCGGQKKKWINWENIHFIQTRAVYVKKEAAISFTLHMVCVLYCFTLHKATLRGNYSDKKCHSNVNISPIIQKHDLLLWSILKRFHLYKLSYINLTTVNIFLNNWCHPHRSHKSHAVPRSCQYLFVSSIQKLKKKNAHTNCKASHLTSIAHTANYSVLFCSLRAVLRQIYSFCWLRNKKNRNKSKRIRGHWNDY